jgi:type I restriction enzyme M protein
MNNSEATLIKLLDEIRKDVGIHNAIDAMEQLSLILLVKYFYDTQFLDVARLKQTISFKDLFFRSVYSDNNIIEKGFSNIKNVFNHVAADLKSSINNLYDSNYVIANWKHVEQLLDAIPFKIRSVKTLETLLYELEELEQSESLSDGYDKLVVKMINDSLSAGSFHSPKALVSSIVKVVNPSPDHSIYDPAMGTGRFFIEVKKLISEHSESSLNESWQAFGKDISSFACLVGTLNLLLNGINIKNISLGDSLLVTDDNRYDIILCGVPFGKPSNIDSYKYNSILTTSSLEAMFLDHSMRMLSRGGKAALIVPDGLLFNRTNDLLELRHELLTKFNLHTILSLPSGTLSPSTGVKVSVLFFDNTQSEKDIWFYELVTNKPLNKTNQISDDDLTEFTDLFSKRSESANSCLVSKQDIFRSEDVCLSLALPRPVAKTNPLDISNELIFLQEKQQDINLLMIKLTNRLSANKQAKFSNKVTIGKLFSAKAGRALNTSEILEKGPYPVYGGNGLRGYFNEYNRVGESILIGRVGAYCGNVHFVKGDFWITDNALSLELRSSQEVYLPYLAHVLRSLNLNKLARGTAMPSISFSTIQDIEIYLPTYEQQIELSEWFDEIQLNNSNLQKELDTQKEKLKELSEYTIFNNCINDI